MPLGQVGAAVGSNTPTSIRRLRGEVRVLGGGAGRRHWGEEEEEEGLAAALGRVVMGESV